MPGPPSPLPSLFFTAVIWVWCFLSLVILPDSPKAKELTKVDLAKRMKVRAVVSIWHKGEAECITWHHAMSSGILREEGEAKESKLLCFKDKVETTVFVVMAVALKKACFLMQTFSQEYPHQGRWKGFEEDIPRSCRSQGQTEAGMCIKTMHMWYLDTDLGIVWYLDTK